MKQSKINDFFQPISPSVAFTQTNSSQLPQKEVKTEVKIQRKGTKGPKVLAPIFSSIPSTQSKRRLSLRSQKLKLENNSSDEHQMDVEVLQLSDDSLDSISEPLPKVSKRNLRNKTIDDNLCQQNLDQLMGGLKLNSPKNTSVLCPPKDNQKLINDWNKLSEKVVLNLEDDIDLRPVFKIPEIPKPKKNKKENSKYLDNEKEKKMSYFLKICRELKEIKKCLTFSPSNK